MLFSVLKITTTLQFKFQLLSRMERF